MIEPYKPSITFYDIWKYRPEDQETHTAVPVVNAVAKVLYLTSVNECGRIAEMLQIDSKILNTIVKFETGIKLSDLLHQYRFRQVTEFVQQNTEAKLEDVAHRFGYASYGSLWRFMQRIGGVTPHGEKSQAGEELWLQWREEKRRKKEKG